MKTLHAFLFCKICIANYEDYYHEQLAKIRSCVKYSIDAYHNGF